MRKSNVITGPHYRGYPLLESNKMGIGVHQEILDKVQAILRTMTSSHNKVFFMRFDVRFPQQGGYPQDNRLFEGFIASFVKNLKRHGLSPMYLWVREQSSNAYQHHYHCCLWLNGSLTQSTYSHLLKAEELWAKALCLPKGTKGLIDYCDHSWDGQCQPNGIMIRRGSSDFESKFNQCFEWSSYLAKTVTKGNCPPGVRQFGCSKGLSSCS